MTTRELIEMSVLHALVLLDDDEQSEFERALRAASPAVQAHVRREQTRLCNIEAILPDVEPPAGLRAVVLARIRDEMARERKRGPAIPLMPVRRVSPMWRAATVGLATAAMVLGGAMLWIRSQIDDIERKIFALDTSVTVENRLGMEIANAAYNPDVPKISFVAVDAGFEGRAVIYIDDEQGKAYLLCDQLPLQDGRSYTLVLVTGEGEQVELAQFTSDGGRRQAPVEVALGANDALVLMAANEITGRPEPMLRTPEGAFSRL